MTAYDMTELSRESQMGAVGTETTDREVRRISIADFEDRFDEIADELWSAATDIGFFQIVDHGIPQDIVDGVFAMANTFFHLPTGSKEQYPLQKGTNAGWEYGTQVPSTRTADQKESYQYAPNRAWTGCWPSGTNWRIPFHRRGFKARCWKIAMDLLGCFAVKLGLDRDFFTARTALVGHLSEHSAAAVLLRLPRGDAR